MSFSFRSPLVGSGKHGLISRCLGALLATSTTIVGAQPTQPPAQDLPYSADFSGLAHGSTTYPTGWQGWSVSSNPSSSYATGAPLGNRNLLGNASAATSTGGVLNYNGKLGLLAGAGVNPGLVLSVNTTNAIDVEVSYQVGTVRDPFNGTTNTRIGSVTLQYRVGVSGAFTSLVDVSYQNPGQLQTGSGVTTPLSPTTKSLTLPASCNNKPVVQLRWVYRDVSGSGERPGFSIDNISVATGVVCTENVTLELRTDLNSNDAAWEIVTFDSNVIYCSGEGYPAGITSPIASTCCLPAGCYRLLVFDNAGDGFGTTGGYQLRTATGDPKLNRIIDNFSNFTEGFLSTMGSGPSAFCLPLSEQKPIYTSRDKLDWTTGSYIVAEEDGAVSAQWQVGDQTDDGYEFWFFDPNGSYSYRRFRNHATSDGFANVGATRACHARVNGWFASNHIPANVLMNVRIRSRVNGQNGAWGPAFRFKIDPVRAACPLTKLMDIPGNPFLSCDQTRTWGIGNYVHARPVSGANRYQFRFRIAAENFNRVITSNNYFVQLNWATQPLIPGKTYDVDVRVSKDGGNTWCVSGNSWGENCKLTIAPGNMSSEGQNLAMNPESSVNAAPRIWPNPGTGKHITMAMEHVPQDVQSLTVELFDLSGKRISEQRIPVAGAAIQTTLDLPGQLAPGTYLVSVTAGEQRHGLRMVVVP